MEQSVVQALSECQLFNGLTERELGVIVESLQYKLIDYKKGEVFAFAGSPCRFVNIIISGELSAEMTGKSGHFVQMDVQRSGRLLAPAFIFAKQNKFPVTITATADTTVLRMIPDELRKLIDSNTIVRYNFIEILSDISVFLAGKMRVLSLHSVREKVAMLLLDEARKAQSMTFQLSLTRQEIADRFGIQKFSLQRCLSDWTERSIIQVDRKTITILDAARLEKEE